MKTFIILPNQLFEHIIPIKEINPDIIFIVEEPFIFYCRERPLHYNKIKLAFLVASMHYYYDYLHKKSKILGNTVIKYIKWSEFPTFAKHYLVETNEIYMYDPVDTNIETYYKNSTAATINFIDTPNFMLSKHDLSLYAKKHPNKTIMGDFFKMAKKKLGVLQNIASTDKYNRLPFPRDFQNIPEYKPPDYETKETKHYYNIAKKYIDNHIQFKDNIGSTTELTRWPITHKDALSAFQSFLKNRFQLYGKYQDAVAKSDNDPILYHSGISPLLNCGLLDPSDVLNRTLEYARNNNIHINNLEGFVRQLLGWREYMRLQYCFYYNKSVPSIKISNNKLSNWSIWYNGTTGITPLDSEIKKAVKYGYSHHIVRLMIFLNMFILLEIRPTDIYMWFMEVCAMDAYDWVMRSNIYCMSWYYPHALAKPYISTSNYILKMTQYKCKKDRVWCVIWDALFYRFISTKKKQLNGSASVYLRNLHYFEKKTPQEKKEILRIANEFIEKQTKRTLTYERIQ